MDMHTLSIIYIGCPYGHTEYKTRGNTHTTDVIHLQHTSCLRGCHVRGKWRFLRVAVNRGMGTSDTTAFTPVPSPWNQGLGSIGHFLISSHIMRGCYTNTDTGYTSCLPSTML